MLIRIKCRVHVLESGGPEFGPKSWLHQPGRRNCHWCMQWRLVVLVSIIQCKSQRSIRKGKVTLLWDVSWNSGTVQKGEVKRGNSFLHDEKIIQLSFNAISAAQTSAYITHTPPWQWLNGVLTNLKQTWEFLLTDWLCPHGLPSCTGWKPISKMLRSNLLHEISNLASY